MKPHSSHMPWVIFHLMNQQYGVSAEYVKEMVAMPTIYKIPDLPQCFRGVINLRGKVIPVVDLRVKLGMVTHQVEIDELIAMLDQREQDHKNWIGKLEDSVRNHTEFSLATDPHKCAFGKWYDNFKTENLLLNGCLIKFDAPHKRIHSIAEKAKKLEEKQDYEAAYQLIDKTKQGDLSEMIQLFARTRALLCDTAREIALVVEGKGNALAVAVDSVETIEKLTTMKMDDLPDIVQQADNGNVIGTARRDKKDDLVLLVDASSMLKDQAETSLSNSIL